MSEVTYTIDKIEENEGVAGHVTVTFKSGKEKRTTTFCDIPLSFVPTELQDVEEVRNEDHEVVQEARTYTDEEKAADAQNQREAFLSGVRAELERRANGWADSLVTPTVEVDPSLKALIGKTKAVESDETLI